MALPTSATKSSIVPFSRLTGENSVDDAEDGKAPSRIWLEWFVSIVVEAGGNWSLAADCGRDLDNIISD
jgi:hypothetical protein